ncbi:hypothetical protein [Burkholderia sp. JKS000303]|uniref:hypothetical protein n=1 Tax=Burkholderia sp. JKS000303 TaxID=1938747 RepID=UPI000C00629B|nr:diguanylate cyclase with GGDEF domain [Burkholderia sp. JKS000303]
MRSTTGAAAGTRDKDPCESRNAADAHGYAIRFSVGHVAYDPARHRTVAGLLESADRRMYEDKQRGKAAGG